MRELLRRLREIFGRRPAPAAPADESTPPADEVPTPADEVPTKDESPAGEASAGDAASRIDAARQRLKESIPPPDES